MQRAFWLTGLASLALTACSGSEEPLAVNGDSPDDVVSEDTAADMTAEDAADAASAGTLEWALAGDWRGANGERDDARHPAETLTFFGIEPTDTVIEIWPGGGWYAEILAPWLNANGGTYVAAHFAADSQSSYRQRSRAAFEERFMGTDLFGDVIVRSWGPDNPGLGEPASADAVLTFRNVHNWMRGGFTERAFDEFYDVLRPGGVLGVVEHRLPDTREQDPLAETGYVQEAYVIAIAREAGFELVDSSEINANPADTADHPNGVWTLPPSQSGWDTEGFDPAPYAAIGESDRMTLLFRKPETEAIPAEGTED
ncbi:class I SAM-dependent methyltransferase [Hyphobacterium sp. CCMP332]|uniref:class I SAM-dependent methyltransferase n=1 Tax=Hyphobacterium sp. CCMP332 TaxID=2749086 RepID=UPI00165070EC|nr:class I SAM-dependent methyltransferase [Hyphobacterium sp. CCMP332]QNL17859.1 class I SAM-dependent methyltransferase [Hyphobacterium sp. CCMP332]